ncbi:MAG: hypothetical protein GY839_05875 [candidate division Zixibacteria bacterium]|nr:hypothetical protein [candidate division Zixibacteria bacterium]
MDYIINNIFSLVVIVFCLAMLFHGGRYIYESLVWPIYSQNKKINEIPELLACLNRAFIDGDIDSRSKLSLISTRAKALATDIMGVKNFIPLYDSWASLGIVIERERVNKIGRDMIFLSNAAHKKSVSPFVIKQIKQKIENIEGYLKLDKQSQSNHPEDMKQDKLPEEETQSNPPKEDIQTNPPKEDIQKEPAKDKGKVTSPE